MKALISWLKLQMKLSELKSRVSIAKHLPALNLLCNKGKVSGIKSWLWQNLVMIKKDYHLCSQVFTLILIFIAVNLKFNQLPKDLLNWRNNRHWIQLQKDFGEETIFN